MEIAMQIIERKDWYSKCLEFRMPRMPRIVERAFSSIDFIFKYDLYYTSRGKLTAFFYVKNQKSQIFFYGA
jgi:hypothetical protein